MSETSKKLFGGRRISISATKPDFSTPISLNGPMRLLSLYSAKPEPARDDPAQHLGGAALQRELGGDRGREGELLFERHAIGRLGLDEGGKLAYAVRQFLFPDRAEVLDDRAFDDRFLAGLQHAGDRYRHPPQGVKLRHEASDTLGAAQIGIGSEHAHQLDQHVERLQE